jgi:hypothetical protein
MRLLLYSGILYLAGVAIILALKPALMFRDDGGWKEFGIGRNPDKYTWFPFWFFVIVWAIVSYCIILILATAGFLPGIDLRPDGSLNNSRNLSRNLYEIKNEILPVVDVEDYLDNEVIEEVADETEKAEGAKLGNLRFFENLEELEVNTPKSNSNSTAKGRRTPSTLASVPTPIPIPTPTKSLNLKKGYYILNTNASTSSNVPKYIYLGPEAPRVLYK